ncbi:MAG TPA: AAA family ATPase, partial [Caldisericia bacterium]|nr:AAA family ATPase [Caldisericia bacterium]
FDDEKALLRFDMSEYMEKFSVSRLIGAPPGYVGYEEGGQLTEAVRRRPYSVILFDEIEKASPDVFNVFLQILDDGRLTDGRGRVVSFKNTVIIMTSNIGSQYIQSANLSYEELRQKVNEILRQQFRPEFINRVDEIVIFNRLGRKEILEIVDIQLRQIEKRLVERGITLNFSDTAKQLIAEKGFDPVFGARPIKRVIQREIVDPLSIKILSKEFNEGDTIIVDAKDGAFIFTK